ncbi:unnamed protein product [Parajaminaea phylloscopi]
MPEASDAGPSTLPHPSSSPGLSACSYRELFEHLEGTRHSRPQDEVVNLLESRAGELRDCGNEARGPSPSSKSKLSSSTVRLDNGEEIAMQDHVRDLAAEASRCHQLDEVEALIAVHRFLNSEDGSLELLGEAVPGQIARSKRKDLAPLSDALLAELLDAFSVFHFEEELYLIRCVSALLRIGEDVTHEYYDAAQRILPPFASDEFGRNCLERTEAIQNKPLPAHIRDSPRYSPFWARHSLRKQLALLEVVFLLYYGQVAPSSRFVVALLTYIESSDMGQKQANQAFFDSDCIRLLACVQHMLAFIAIESLDLERAMDGYSVAELHAQASAPSDLLIQTPKAIIQALDVLETTAARPSRSPILLAWSLVLRRLDDCLSQADPSELQSEHLQALQAAATPSDEGDPVWARLASAALAPQMGLFDTMRSMAASPLLSSDSSSIHLQVTVASSLAFRAVFKGLLLSITEVVRPEFVPDFAQLVELWEVTFGCNMSAGASEGTIAGIRALSSQFWQTDMTYETRQGVLETAKRRWPVQLRPLLRLLRALTGTCQDEMGTLPETAEEGEDSLAALSVLRQFSSLQSLAQVLPSTAGALRPPWEVIESADYSVLDYRATRSIPLLGPHLVVPAGTVGRMVSDVGRTPIVVVWQLKETVSGWQILRDILASFVNLLVDPTEGPSEQDDVFGLDDRRFPDIESLAPGDGDHASIAVDALDLLSAVLTGAPSQTAALLEHLEEPNVALSDQRRQAPGLVAITRKILERALSTREPHTRLIQSAYRLLGILLQCKPTEVWLAIRSSNLIIGSSGQASWTARSALSKSATTSNSSMLPLEIAGGSFAGLRSLLALQSKLWSELQRSQFAVPPDLLRIKVDVLLRAIKWVSEFVWPEFQSWRFAESRERHQIGLECARLLRQVLTDRVSNATPAVGEVIKLVEGLLVSHVSMSHLHPIISVIGTGQSALDTMYRSGRHSEAEQVHELIATCLGLAQLVVHRRRELSAQGVMPARTLGVLENVFLSSSPALLRPLLPSNRRDTRAHLLTVLFDYIKRGLSVELSRQATTLITSMALSSADSSGPSFSSHLGSLQEVESFARSIVELLDNTHLDVSLRAAIWTMAAAFVETQPPLATFLLTGSLGGDVDGVTEISRRTALQVGTDTISIWSPLWQEDAALLDAILHFLGSAWASHVDHPGVLDKLRGEGRFWTSVTAIISADVAEWSPFDDGDDFRDLGTLERLQMDHGNAVQLASRQMMCQARALFLLATDLTTQPNLRKKGTKSASVESAYNLITSASAPTLSSLLEAAVTISANPDAQADVESRVAATFPEVALPSLRHPPRRDDFDLDRCYGIDYVYDLVMVRAKLEGFCQDTGDETEVLDQSVIERAIVLLGTVNLDWSIVDCQTARLRSWKKLLEAFARRTRSEYKAQSRERDVRDSYLKAWAVSAKVAADEDRQGPMMTGIHAERISLLEAVLEGAWGQEAHEPSAQATGEATDIETLQAVVEQAQRLLAHPVFSIETSVLGAKPSFHRSTFAIVLLCVRRCCRAMPSRTLRASQGVQSESHRALHYAVDSFTRHTVVAARQIVDGASVLCASRPGTLAQDTVAEQLASAEDDLTLVANVLELLVRTDVSLEPHYWLGQIRETGLLEALSNLLRRAPQRRSPSTGAVEAQSAPVFAPAILFLFLALAGRQQSAEQAIHCGLMTALTSNALSTDLEAGTLVRGSGAHSCWVTMLRILVAVVENLDADTTASWASASLRFIETEVVGFVRLYGASIGKSLDFSPLGTSKGGPSRSPVRSRQLVAPSRDAGSSQIDRAQLSELHAVMWLFLVMASSDQGRVTGTTQPTHGGGREILATFAVRGASILQQLVYLTQRPHQLATLLHGEACDDGEADRLAAQLGSIAATVIAALWHQSQGCEVLSWQEGLPPPPVAAEPLLRPTMRASPGDPASIGTLLDFASYNTDVLAKADVAPDALTQAVLALEQTLSLAVSQMVLHAQGSAADGGRHLVVETGIQRDLSSSVTSALDALQALSGKRGDEVDGEVADGVILMERLGVLCAQLERGG